MSYLLCERCGDNKTGYFTREEALQYLHREYPEMDLARITVICTDCAKILDLSVRKVRPGDDL